MNGGDSEEARQEIIHFFPTTTHTEKFKLDGTMQFPNIDGR